MKKQESELVHRCDILLEPWIGAQYFASIFDFLCIGFRKVYIPGRIRYFYPEDEFAPETPFLHLQTATEYMGDRYGEFCTKFYQLVRQGKVCWYFPRSVQICDRNPFIPLDILSKIHILPQAEKQDWFEPLISELTQHARSDKDIQARVRNFRDSFEALYVRTTVDPLDKYCPDPLEYFYSQLIEMALFDIPRAIHPSMQPLWEFLLAGRMPKKQVFDTLLPETTISMPCDLTADDILELDEIASVKSLKYHLSKISELSPSEKFMLPPDLIVDLNALWEKVSTRQRKKRQLGASIITGTIAGALGSFLAGPWGLIASIPGAYAGHRLAEKLAEDKKFAALYRKLEKAYYRVLKVKRSTE